MQTRTKQAQQPAFQLFITFLGGLRHEGGAHNLVGLVVHAPDQIGIALAIQCSSIGQGRQILTDLLWVSVIALELQPGGFRRELAQLTHQANEIVGVSFQRHTLPLKLDIKPSLQSIKGTTRLFTAGTGLNFTHLHVLPGGISLP
ncbi:hypothetical protein D3C85_1117610 [compost metagenome]